MSTGNPGVRISTISSTTAYQVVWSAIGIAAFVAVLVLVRRPGCPQRYTYALGAAGLVLMIRRCCPPA